MGEVLHRYERTLTHTMVAKGAIAKGECGDPQPSCGHKLCWSVLFFAAMGGSLVALIMAFTGTVCLCDGDETWNTPHKKKCGDNFVQTGEQDCCWLQDESDGKCLTVALRLYLIIGGAVGASAAWCFLCAWCACCCFAPDPVAMAPGAAPAAVAAPAPVIIMAK